MRNLIGKISGVAIAATFLMGSAASWADPVALTNPSFEAPILADEVFNFGATSIPGWSRTPDDPPACRSGQARAARS